MFSLEIGPAIYERTSAQLRFLHENYYYKIDTMKNSSESIVEELSTVILKYSTLNDKTFVKYESGWCNGEHACRSKNFVGNDEELITFVAISKRLSELPRTQKVRDFR